MAAFDLITLDIVSDNTKPQPGEFPFTNLEEMFISNVDQMFNSKPKVKQENPESPQSNQYNCAHTAQYPNSTPNVGHSQPTPTFTVSQSAGPNSSDFSNLSPEFLEARNEALYLGLQGDQLANYVLGKLKQGQVIHVPDQSVSGPKIRLERWKIKEENFETFLHRFERLASDLNWSEDIKLLHLISCLEGKALEIYRRCDQERRVSYDELCMQLDQAFAETATEKAKKFAESKLDILNETPSQYAINLREKFLTWFRKANPGRQITMESLLNHIVREKFVESLPERLKVMIAQKELLDIEEIAEFSDRFFEAQKNSRSSQEGKNQESKGAIGKKNMVSSKKQDHKRELKCFICKSTKHIARNCTSRHTTSAAVETVTASTGTAATPTVTTTPAVPTIGQTGDSDPKGTQSNSQGSKKKQDQIAKRKGNK